MTGNDNSKTKGIPDDVMEIWGESVEPGKSILLKNALEEANSQSAPARLKYKILDQNDNSSRFGLAWLRVAKVALPAALALLVVTVVPYRSQNPQIAPEDKLEDALIEFAEENPFEDSLAFDLFDEELEDLEEVI